VSNLIVRLGPGAKSDALPESHRGDGNEEQRKSSETDLGFFGLVEIDGHQDLADHLILVNSHHRERVDSLGAEEVARGLIFGVLSVVNQLIHVVFLVVLIFQLDLLFIVVLETTTDLFKFLKNNY